MRYYSEDTVRGIIKIVAHTALEQLSLYADDVLQNQPSIEIKEPHGDLGDISELYVDILADLQTSKIQTLQDVLKILNEHFDNAPTILEASNKED